MVFSAMRADRMLRAFCAYLEKLGEHSVIHWISRNTSRNLDVGKVENEILIFWEHTNEKQNC